MNTLTNSLFLCSTPFQAKICLSIIKFIGLKSFDIIYFTKQSNATDLYYYSELQKASNHSHYIYISRNIKGLNALLNINYLRKIDKYYIENTYDNIFLASFDNLIFRYILKNNPTAKLYGFDDGAANIFPENNEFNDTRARTAFINNVLKLPSDQEVIKNLVKHYTIYKNFDPFIEKEKVIEIPLINSKTAEASSSSNNKISFFIGQPFHEYLNRTEIFKLKQWLSKSEINYYILHPRESEPLVSTIPILEKKAMLAEDCILNKSVGKQSIVYAGFSTVLFNLNSKNISKVYLSLSNSEIERGRCEIIKKTESIILDL